MPQQPSLGIQMATFNRWMMHGVSISVRVHAVADLGVFMLNDLRLSVSICVLI